MAMPEARVLTPLEQRFDAKVDRSGDCWLWTGCVDRAGYGRIREGGRATAALYAHRYSYERFVGPIPEGLELDHLCRVRRCVNPAHLEATTHRVNALRGKAPTVLLHHAKKCKRGHDNTPENTYYNKRTGRVSYCRICRRHDRKAANAGGD